MSSAPGVSIVLPVFNDEETVAAALDSCLAQTLTEIEIVCVDDGSTDGTVRVVEQYARRDTRIRLLQQEQNMSAFQARRRGILEAAGEYVLFLDGDDELLPEAAERALAIARRDDADLVGFGIAVIGVDGNVVGGYQKRLAPKHQELTGVAVLHGLFPIGEPAQGQLWRYLFRTLLLREAYAKLPAGLVLPRVNDLPLMFLVATLAGHYVSTDEQLYRYYYGQGGSGQAVESLETARFYAEAIRSVDSIQPAVREIARASSDPGVLLDSYESTRLSIVGYVTAYLLKHTKKSLVPDVLDHLRTCAPATDLVLSAVRFYPDSLPALKAYSISPGLGNKPANSIMLTTRMLTTGGVSGVLLAQATLLIQAGFQVTIVARRYGSDPSAVPEGATFIEMVGQGLPERLVEWANLCREHEVDVIIDHQVLYSRDWPEYALMARSLGVATIGWLHNFAGRPIYDLNGLHALLQANAPLLEMLVSLSPLDVAFWKLRGVQHSAYVPNSPSPLLLESVHEGQPKQLADRRRELIWWGRLDEQTKQMTQLIEVADQLRKLSVDFHLTVIGPDWGEWTADRFNALVQKRRLNQYVQAVGARLGQDLIDAIDAADAFVTTSVIEGYQLTIAEAQARGVPVFMYELPWLTLVQDNRGVVAVPQGDAAALADQLAAAFNDPNRYSQLSQDSIIAARRELSYDFSSLYQQVVTGSLPPEFSPEPTLVDAQQLLDLMIFFAERNAGARVPEKNAKKKVRATAPPMIRESSMGHRVWDAAKPLGRIILQVLPGLRPLAHRTKRRLLAGRS